MRWIGFAVILWLGAIALVVVTGGSHFPIHVPATEPWSVVERLTAAHVIGVEVAVLSGLTWLATRSNHPTSDQLIARGPSPAVARRELVVTAAYLVLAQAIGAVLGQLLGWGPISYHLIGSVHGTHHPVHPGMVLGWAAYNVVAYVIVPGIALLRRYRPRQLWLRSTDRGRDLRVVVLVLTLESTFQLLAFGGAFFALSGAQLALGSVLTLAIFTLGTVLPTLVIVAVVVVPRVLVITGSASAAVVAGGVTYALVHLFDGWTDYRTPQLAALSLGLLVLQYLVPGMFKAWLTLRTGNAWVHAWAYHAVAPHVWADTPLIVRVFGIR